MNKFWRYLIYIIGILLIFSITSSLIRVVKKNYDLKLQVATLKQENDLLSAQNQELGYEINYYSSASFQDKEARDKLGLQSPGEKVIILPSDQRSSGQSNNSSASLSKSNFQQWLDFLLGR